MADQLLKNTCFHEINADGIPDNTDITRIVSLNGNDATMHTRQAGDDTGAFDPALPADGGVRLFLITSYNEAGVGDDNDESDTERDNRVAVEAARRVSTDEDGMSTYSGSNAAGTQSTRVESAGGRGFSSAASSQVNSAKIPDKEAALEKLKPNLGEQKIKQEKAADNLGGGKRTRRRKNHGSKRRNASNKRGRRASKQSRGRGKKQSKRHGRK